MLAKPKPKPRTHAQRSLTAEDIIRAAPGVGVASSRFMAPLKCENEGFEFYFLDILTIFGPHLSTSTCTRATTTTHFYPKISIQNIFAWLHNLPSLGCVSAASTSTFRRPAVIKLLPRCVVVLLGCWLLPFFNRREWTVARSSKYKKRKKKRRKKWKRQNK